MLTNAQNDRLSTLMKVLEHMELVSLQLQTECRSSPGDFLFQYFSFVELDIENAP
jgi:hypothetical protein